MVKRVLVFAAHPDDDIIGCGGSLAKHVKLGNQVSVCYMTSGEAGSLDYPKEELSRIREEEAKDAAQVVGFQDLTFLRNPDGYLQCDMGNLKTLVELIREKRPNLVYVHHASDGHQDHRATFQLVNEALVRASVRLYQEYTGTPWSAETVLAYEVWTALVDFEYVEDISEFIDKKVTALRKHESQMKNARYDEAFEGLARYRGAMTGRGKYCEIFKVIKMFNLPQ
jgi:LmbE family N-acetylglucosaminyl deacetylase